MTGELERANNIVNNIPELRPETALGRAGGHGEAGEGGKGDESVASPAKRQPAAPINNTSLPTPCRWCGYACTKDREVCPRWVRRVDYEVFMRAGFGDFAFERFTLLKFEPKGEIRTRALAAVKTFTLRDNLFIFGPVGCGKTHLAVATARRWPELWPDFHPSADFLRSLRLRLNSFEEHEFMVRYCKAPVLVLDDIIEREKSSAFSYGCFFELVDTRIRHGRGGLLLTSNQDLDQLARRYNDEALSSRIFGHFKIIDLSKLTSADDWRSQGPSGGCNERKKDAED